MLLTYGLEEGRLWWMLPVSVMGEMLGLDFLERAPSAVRGESGGETSSG